MSSIIPRFIRYRDAPTYLGMDKNRFDEEVRPKIDEIPIGKQGVAFDRVDLDAWADDYRDRCGRPARRKRLWDGRNRQESTCETVSTGSTKQSEESELQNLLDQAISKKQKGISQNG